MAGDTQQIEPIDADAFEEDMPAGQPACDLKATRPVDADAFEGDVPAGQPAGDLKDTQPLDQEIKNTVLEGQF